MPDENFNYNALPLPHLNLLFGSIRVAAIKN